MLRYLLSANIRSDAISPTIIDGAFVLPDGIDGKIEASATRNPSTPRTFSSDGPVAV